ncbi:MAG TPA: phosphatase PAP2 family protein, partial [Longimicrobium sp.]|nr:phosphatase PAP2 family protein [Longimicrobium sp.]
TDRGDGGKRALALGAAAAVAAAGFGVLAAAVARRDMAGADHAARKRTAPRRGHPARRAAKALSPAGKWWTYIPGALGASLYVLRAAAPPGEDRPRSRRTGAGAVFLAGVVATALNPAFDHWLPQPPTPPGHRKRNKAVFPSGHAFGPSAVSLAAAYVLSRERLARPGAAFPAALAIPAFTAGARMLQEKHWASDVLGGYLGGAAVAAACLAAYEAAGER